MQKKTIVDYVKGKNIDDPKVALIIIPTDRSCPSCNDFVLNYYSENYKNLKDKPVYIVIGGNNKLLIEDILKRANIKEEMKSKIIIDNNNLFSQYTEYFFNPKLFIINENKIIVDEGYKPSDLFKIQIRITDFINNLN